MIIDFILIWSPIWCILLHGKRMIASLAIKLTNDVLLRYEVTDFCLHRNLSWIVSSFWLQIDKRTFTLYLLINQLIIYLIFTCIITLTIVVEYLLISLSLYFTLSWQLGLGTYIYEIWLMSLSRFFIEFCNVSLCRNTNLFWMIWVIEHIELRVLIFHLNLWVI